jgi:hypothetical protein
MCSTLHCNPPCHNSRNGLDSTPDGTVGSSTLAALNVPVVARVRQIQSNMERWRWLLVATMPRGQSMWDGRWERSANGAAAPHRHEVY